MALTVTLCAMAIRSGADVDFDRLRALAAQRYGQRAGEAVDAWHAMVDAARDRPVMDKLARVNDFFNQRIRFDEDIRVWGQQDYWATPLETLGAGAGDCEDFVIAKYVTLRQLGIPDRRLRLIYVRAQLGGAEHPELRAHMVLGYFAAGTEDPLLLDNLVERIRPASLRPDLLPVFSFNGTGLWAGGAVVALDPTIRLSRWRDVLFRMGEEGIK